MSEPIGTVDVVAHKLTRGEPVRFVTWLLAWEPRPDMVEPRLFSARIYDGRLRETDAVRRSKRSDRLVAVRLLVEPSYGNYEEHRVSGYVLVKTGFVGSDGTLHHLGRYRRDGKVVLDSIGHGELLRAVPGLAPVLEQ